MILQSMDTNSKVKTDKGMAVDRSFWPSSNNLIGEKMAYNIQ